jgi:peptidoglycan/xylan/chitin deacetylase (PgdA/CDA1 family)
MGRSIAVRRRYRALRSEFRHAAIKDEIAHRHGIRDRALALTFDDGPSAWTEPILDTLRELEVAATFFVIGEAVQGNEAILRRAAGEGHEVGNHSHTHPHLDRLRVKADIEAELAEANEAIEAVLGMRPRLFRPPFLGCSSEVRRAARGVGLEWTVLASIFPHDYAPEASPPSVVDEIMRAGPRSGSIIDLHDGRPLREAPSDATGPSREATALAVRELVPRLLEGGFRFVTVSELLEL